MLVALNINTIYDALLASAGTDEATADSIGKAMKATIDYWTGSIDGQLTNAVVWGATGGIAFMSVVAVAAFVNQEREDAIAARTSSGKKQFIVRTAVSAAAIWALVLFLVVLTTRLAPAILEVFVSRLVTITEAWYNGLFVLGAIISAAASAYFIAILCRLIMLRVRVFSEEIGY